MALPQDFLMELKYKNDIESVLSPYISLKRRGSNLVGLCPFHNEKTPSFTVYPEDGSYYCFGCGQGGDIITFTMRIENLDYIDAVRRLADRAGLRVPESGQSDKNQDMKNAIYEANREAARFYHACLMSPQGRLALENYLSRGLSIKTIKHFGLGYAPDEWHALKNHLKSKGFSYEVMLAADLLAKSSKTDAQGRNYTYDRFVNRMMFPLINLHGKVIGFSGRAMPGNEKKGGKYVNTSDTPVFKKSHNMYALNFAKKVCAERAILVEGNMDVIALHQAGFENAVAALGTSFTDEQARLLGRYTKEVVVTMDADEAGEKSTDRAMKILSRAGVDARILRLPECKDPDEFIKKNGAARFEALLDGAISDIDYRLYTAAKNIDLDAADGKLQYLKNACAVLAELNDPIAVDLYAGKLSVKYGTAKDVLIKEVNRIQEYKNRQNTKKQLEGIVVPRINKDAINPQKQQYRRAAAAEESVISVLIKHPDLYENTVDKLTEDDFITDFNRRLYSKLVSIISTGHAFDLVLLSGEFTPDEIGHVTKMLTLGIGNTNPEKELNDSIKVILQEKSAREKQAVGDLPDDEWAAAMKQMFNKNNK